MNGENHEMKETDIKDSNDIAIDKVLKHQPICHKWFTKPVKNFHTHPPPPCFKKISASNVVREFTFQLSDMKTRMGSSTWPHMLFQFVLLHIWAKWF